MRFAAAFAVALAAVAAAGCAARPGASAAGRPLKVLMIGNSFSISVLDELPACAKDAGVKLDLVSLYIGGCSLERHVENARKAAVDPAFAPYKVTWHYDSLADQALVPFAGRLSRVRRGGLEGDANIPEMLKADRWDVVSVQQASHFSWDPATYEDAGRELVATVRALAPQAEVVVQETWSYCAADPRISGAPGGWGFDQDGMYERLRGAYERFSADHGLRRIPTGAAVQAFRRLAAVADAKDDVVGRFWRDANGAEKADTIHLNRTGEYLQALVWLGTLYDVDVARVRYRPEPVGEERARLAREAAAAACRRYRGGGR